VTQHPWNPGDITLRDLAAYEVIVREPVCGAYRVYRVCGFPLPSSGGIAVLQMLKMLERFDMASLAPASFFAVHFVSEAGRLAFADRSVYEADPAFYTPPQGLLDDAYLPGGHRSSARREPAARGAGQTRRHPKIPQGRRRVAGAAVDARTSRSSTATAMPSP
jgi:gamma-glutamyltranspeptidase/glutathione hydrolase